MTQVDHFYQARATQRTTYISEGVLVLFSNLLNSSFLEEFSEKSNGS